MDLELTSYHKFAKITKGFRNYTRDTRKSVLIGEFFSRLFCDSDLWMEVDVNEDITRHVFKLSPPFLAEMSIFFDGLRIKPTCHSRSTMLRTIVTGVVRLNITSAEL